MRIGCLQFAPQLGKVEENIRKADSILVLSGIKAGDLDLLVLPELAFTGYNFTSLEIITPFLEKTGAGVSTRWAQRTALSLQCTVIVGYPEVDENPHAELSTGIGQAQEDDCHGLGRPVRPRTDVSFPYNYNSTVTVNRTADIVHHHRKVHLYYTEETWAREGDGWHSVELKQGSDDQSYRTTMGICMDLNNKNFTAPWTAYEFANSIVASRSELVIVSMAWSSQLLTPMDVHGAEALKPDLETLQYWPLRLTPLINNLGGEKVVAVFANRSGIEGDTNYAGTSSVMRLGSDRVEIFDMLGKGEERVLLVDTEDSPKYSIAGFRQGDVQ